MKLLNTRKMTALTVLGGVITPSLGWACACGCGVFDVGGSSMLPTGPGGMAYVQYDWQNQNHNWSGTSQAPMENNSDRQIKTDFITIGGQYMFNRRWGAQIEIPYDYRTFRTYTGNGPGGITTLKWDALGDLRVHALYTGFSPDLSSGLDFGLKLPTGNFTHNDADGDIDRDTEIGSGSTDILLGGYHRGNLSESGLWNWYVQGEFDLPVLAQNEYRPGLEFDADAGIDYQGWSFGRVQVSPLAQAIFSFRGSDTGAEASGGALDDPADGVASGYERVLLSPGLEFQIHPVVVYMDAEVPVWQNFVGNQLAAAVLFKLSVSYHF